VDTPWFDLFSHDFRSCSDNSKSSASFSFSLFNFGISLFLLCFDKPGLKRR